MRRNISVKNEEIRSNPRFFQGNIPVIAVGNAIRSFGGGFISTYISLYFVELGGNPLTLGLMASIAFIVQCVMLPLGGFIADYYGRRRITVLTAFYGVFFPLFYAVIRDWRLFAALNIIATLGAISNPASHAIVADSIPPEKRTTGIASLQVLSSLPLTVGPLIGGWLIQNYGLLDGFRLACMYAAASALASALIVLVFLKETLRPRPASKSNFFNPGKLISFLKPPHPLPTSLKALLVSYALVIFANGAVGQYYIIYANRVIGLTPLEWGIIVGLQFLVIIVLKVPGGWFSDRFGKRKVMIVSVVMCAPCTILFTLSRSFVETLTVALLLTITGMHYAPAHQALQANLTPKAMRGRITALWEVGNALSGTLGILIGGFLFQTVNPALPFYLFTAAELTAALLLISIIKEPLREEV